MNQPEKKPTHKVVTTLGGRSTITWPVEAVGLGQAMMVIAGNKVYHLWTEEEVKGVTEAAFTGRQWIEEHPAADTKGKDMRALHGGASCCQHTSFHQHLEDSVRKGYKGVVPHFRRTGRSTSLTSAGTERSQTRQSQNGGADP